MTFAIASVGSNVHLVADQTGLRISTPDPKADLCQHDKWPLDARAEARGLRLAYDIEQLIESGLAIPHDTRNIEVPYEAFQLITDELKFDITNVGVQPSPFLLRIDRKSDIGRPDFRYRYQFLIGTRAVAIERIGYYCRRVGRPQVYILDSQAYALVEAMDRFNALPDSARTVQECWLTFAKVKGCAAEVGAQLDATLQSNDVIVPSSIGLDIREDETGALTFLPRYSDVGKELLQEAFERNPGAEKIYTVDRGGQGRTRVVLNDDQHEVLKRMKRVRQVRGDMKDKLKQDPLSVFDGVEIDEPQYGSRVIGIGEMQFAPIPKPFISISSMSNLWKDVPLSATLGSGNETGSASPLNDGRQPESEPNGNIDAPTPGPTPTLTSGADDRGGTPEAELPAQSPASAPKVLLIETNEESVRDDFLESSERASNQAVPVVEYQRPESLLPKTSLKPHQVEGVRWLQTCARIADRRGVLLADDMGLGKTLQILSFLAWCIESGRFPELSRPKPPFSPILVVAPLILVDTRVWEREMEQFFHEEGSVFWPVVTLHGGTLASYRRQDVGGSETQICAPALDLNRIRRHRVVITNYDTLKNYHYSFASLQDGRPIWSVVVADEAQEFKIPNTRLSHAMKAIDPPFRIACTGTPVENRLLDLWNICDTIQPGLLSSARDFVRAYETKAQGTTRAESLDDLKRKLLFQQPHSFLLRRNKSDVANLPPKTIVKMSCVMSESEVAAHHRVLSEMAKAGENQTSMLKILAKFAVLYQHPDLLLGPPDLDNPQSLLARSSKLQACVRQLRMIAERNEKAIIFARHREVQVLLSRVFEHVFSQPVRIINGETKLRAAASSSREGVRTRSAILDDFKRRPGFNMLILSPFVAGIGLTITEANHVFHYGRWWNPAVEAQATDRAYRIGQEKEVYVYLPILTDPAARIGRTFDEILDDLMETKSRLAEDFLRPLAEEAETGTELYQQIRNLCGIGTSGM